jgi:predicted transcriptional regulator
VILNEKDAANIMLLILEAANDHAEGDTKKMGATTKTTHIMYRALFNHPPLKQFWNSLIQKGLLDFDPTTGRFKTTAEGRAFLRVYEAIDHDVIKASTRTLSSSSSSSSPSRLPRREKQLVQQQQH